MDIVKDCKKSIFKIIKPAMGYFTPILPDGSHFKVYTQYRTDFCPSVSAQMTEIPAQTLTTYGSKRHFFFLLLRSLTEHTVCVYNYVHQSVASIMFRAWSVNHRAYRHVREIYVEIHINSTSKTIFSGDTWILN